MIPNPVELLQREIIEDLLPLQDPMPGEEAAFVPEALTDRLFSDAGDGQSLHVYALLDAGKLKFLPDRLSQSGLAHVSLYTHDTYADVAPYLVQLTPDADLTRHFFAFDSEQDSPWYMMDKSPGILLRSTHSLQTLQAHLRHYTMLPDEEGVRQFFRFHEPGFLDAVLQCCGPEEVGSFFSCVQDFLYLMPALQEGLWDAIQVAPGPGVAAPPNGSYALPEIDRPKRQAMQRTLSTRQGRDLARREGRPLPERRPRARIYARLLNAGFYNENALVVTASLLAKIPAAEHQAIWTVIEQGEHSLGFLNFKLAERYGLEAELT